MIDYCIEGDVKDINPRAEVVFELCLLSVILEQVKTHHFITVIQHKKDVVLFAVDNAMHDV